MEPMKTHTGSLFRDLRKLYGYTQVEMAEKLNVSQSTISKVESEVFVPELTLWFDFVREFGVLDPYCFYYGTAELRDIPNLSLANKDNWHGAWAAKHKKKFSVTVRALAPLITHLKTHANAPLKTLLGKHGATPAVLTVLNYPVPWDVVWGMFELAEDSKARFNLATLTPTHEEQGGFFPLLSQHKSAQGCIDFIQSRSNDYFGAVKFTGRKGEFEGIPASIPASLKKPFSKYLADYPTYLSRSPQNQISA